MHQAIPKIRQHQTYLMLANNGDAKMKTDMTTGRARAAVLATVASVLLAACGGSDDNGSAPPQSATPWPGGIWSPAEASYRSGVDEGVNVTMSDGTILKADVAYPIDPATGARATGSFPVLLTQSPYVNANPRGGDYYVQRGYIYVTAHVRGTTTSGGSFMFFSDRDAKDGAELVNWAAKLPNSTGTVGMHGNSYMGLTQAWTLAALGKGSPVKALSASCMGAEFYRETYFAGGIPTQTLNFQRVIGSSMGGDTAVSGAANVADIEAGGDKAYFRTFWKERTVGALAQKLVDADVPILLWSSNGDIYAQSSLDLYAYLQNGYAKQPVYGPMSRSAAASGRYQIIMSQGGHCAGIDQRVQLEWFDTWLKGARTDMEKTAMPIHIHEQLSNRWFNTSHYPMVPAYTRYYLNNGSLATSVPTAQGQSNLVWGQPSANSTVQFDSAAFASGASLAGPISASIYASSTTSNLQLIATLVHVDAAGTSTVLTSGAVLGSLAENDAERSWTDKNGVPTRPYGKYEADVYVPAGTIKKYDFVISPRFVNFQAGSKLRVIFTTQTPTSRCSPVLGTDPCFPTAPQVASLSGSTVSIYHGGTYNSSINLPLAKAGCWKSSDNPSIPFWDVDPAVNEADAPCQR
jgi:predicted acyl esterase